MVEAVRALGLVVTSRLRGREILLNPVELDPMLALNVLDLDPVLALDFLELDPVVRRGRFPPGGLAIGMRAPTFLLDAILHAGNAVDLLMHGRRSPLAASWAELRSHFQMVPLLQRGQAERGGGFTPVGGRKARRKQQATVSDWRCMCPEPSFDGPAYEFNGSTLRHCGHAFASEFVNRLIFCSMFAAAVGLLVAPPDRS